MDRLLVCGRGKNTSSTSHGRKGGSLSPNNSYYPNCPTSHTCVKPSTSEIREVWKVLTLLTFSCLVKWFLKSSSFSQTQKQHPFIACLPSFSCFLWGGGGRPQLTRPPLNARAENNIWCQLQISWNVQEARIVKHWLRPFFKDKKTWYLDSQFLL